MVGYPWTQLDPHEGCGIVVDDDDYELLLYIQFDCCSDPLLHSSRFLLILEPMSHALLLLPLLLELGSAFIFALIQKDNYSLLFHSFSILIYWDVGKYLSILKQGRWNVEMSYLIAIELVGSELVKIWP